jgi:tRNA(adenine34) deaminase
MSDALFMAHALELAREAEGAGEVPIGAVVVKDGQVIATGRNRTREWNDPTAHAEVIALRDAAKNVGNFRLDGAVLFVTLEPCPMCSGAIFQSRLARVVFGASDPKTGCAGSVVDLFAMRQLNHHTQITAGVCAVECSDLLQSFFKSTRAQQHANAEPLRQDALRTSMSAFAEYRDITMPGVYFYDPDGYRMHCIDKGESDSKAVILCLHDMAYWSHQFWRLMGPLQDAGLRVLIPDLLGCGLSDKPKKGSWHSVQNHVRSLQHLCASFGVVPTHILAIGSSAAIADSLIRSSGWDTRLVSVRSSSGTGGVQDELKASDAAVNPSVWAGKRKAHLAGMSAESQKAMMAPFPDPGYAAVLEGLRDIAFQTMPPATLTVESGGCVELNASLCTTLMAELMRG